MFGGPSTHDRQEVEHIVERCGDGGLYLGELPEYLHEDDFLDAPTAEGIYVAEIAIEHWHWPGDFFNPPEDDHRTTVERYRKFDPERETMGLWNR